MNTKKQDVVLLTRQRVNLCGLKESLIEKGVRVETVEMLQIEPRMNASSADLLTDLKKFTDLIFVSKNAAQIFLDYLSAQDIQLPSQTSIWAVGGETAQLLQEKGIKAEYPDKDVGAKALLALPQMQQLQNRRILILRGEKGLDWPAEEMAKRGALVESAVLYRQIVSEQSKREFQAVLSVHEAIDFVFLHSALSAANFLDMANTNQRHFKDSCLIVGSHRIKEFLVNRGWSKRIVVAQSPSNQPMLEAFTAVH